MLWKEWEKHYKSIGLDPTRICKDGVIDIDEWNKCSSKVLFVMKEVNGGHGWDLMEFLSDGPKHQMWHAISRWAAGIQNGFPNYDSINNRESMRKALLKISTINLKKTSGGASSNMSLINSYAKSDSPLLVKQIEQINPKVIVAGGTFDSLIWLLDLSVNPDSPYEDPIYDSVREAWVIPWRHPGRVNNRETYEELSKCFRKIHAMSA